MSENKYPIGGYVPGDKPLHCTLTDTELAAKADQWIDELIASGGKSFTMQIPARPNADPDLIFAELNDRFKKLIAQPKPAGAVWVKATDRLPGWGVPVQWRCFEGQERGFKETLAEMIHVRPVSLHSFEWLDESGTATTELPTFWDVAKVFKWAAEYGNEQGEEFLLLEGQWKIIRGGDDETGNEDLTPGNVAELYCLQNGFYK